MLWKMMINWNNVSKKRFSMSSSNYEYEPKINYKVRIKFKCSENK